MQDQIKAKIKTAVSNLYGKDFEVEIDRPEEEFGDFSTNLALKLAKDLKKAPKDIAAELVEKLKEDPMFIEVSPAGPGFINIKLSNVALIDLINAEPKQDLAGKEVVVEFSDPNPFKILHAGHLYTSVIGDSIANLLSAAGANVHRVNFGGDVGLHVARNMWAIVHDLGGELPENLANINEGERSEWLSACYVQGNDAYETNDEAKAAIRELNKRLYDIALNQDKQSNLAKIYWTCRQWSYDYFNDFYERLNISFERYYPESEVAGLGVSIVKEHIPEIYQKSQGAVIFEGEKYGLYNNVFINSEGLPTYAAKDVGLITKKWQDYHYDKSIIITANEIADYMKVVLKSVEQFAPEMSKPTVHIVHGIVKLIGGKKMSSRAGNIIKAVDLLDLTTQATKERKLNADPKITTAAVKYAFIKQRIGGDIIYDPSESVSIEGNSGPYLQYAYARAVSITKKAEAKDYDLKSVEAFTKEERLLIRKIGEYAEVVELAIKELKPHHVAGYLYALAQTFNHFYESSRVIGDERQDIRLALVKIYANQLAAGLKLLGLEPIESI